MKATITENFVLNYPIEVQRKHLLDVGHLLTVHSATLTGLRIKSLQKNEREITFLSEMFLNPLRLFRRKKEHSRILVLSEDIYLLEISQRIKVLFILLPLTDEKHFFSISVFADFNPVIKAILKPFLRLAIYATIFEDLTYYKGASLK